MNEIIIGTTFWIGLVVGGVVNDKVKKWKDDYEINLKQKEVKKK